MMTEAVTTQAPFQMKLNAAIECILRDANESMMRGDYNVALRLYDKVIHNEPTNKTALLNKGKTYEHLGDYPAAIRMYGSLIEVDEFNSEAWYKRGMAMKKCGAFVEGIINIRMGIALSLHEK